MVAPQRVVDRWNYIINDLCVAVKMGAHGPGCRLSVPEPSCERLRNRSFGLEPDSTPSVLVVRASRRVLPLGSPTTAVAELCGEPAHRHGACAARRCRRTRRRDQVRAGWQAGSFALLHAQDCADVEAGDLGQPNIAADGIVARWTLTLNVSFTAVRLAELYFRFGSFSNFRPESAADGCPAHCRHPVLDASNVESTVING